MLKINDIPGIIRKFWKFLTEDVWRIVPSELSNTKRKGYTVIKVILLAVRRYQEDNLPRNASALTYSTFLSLIPLLAVLLAIAKGFGFRNIVESQLFEYFPGQKEILFRMLTFVNSYMQQTKDGLFLGLGLLLLFYTVFNLISGIENTFNMIWQVSKGRSIVRRFTDYFSTFLFLPIFLVCSSGISIFFATTFNTLKYHQLLMPVYEIIITVAPWIISIFAFTGLYLFMPNTKVRFKHAFYAGILAAIGFQIVQYLYINGQMWVSKYNAIYGSFALIPLLLLWVQLSWMICLIGAEIAYAGQNIQNFEFENDSKNISRRYLDFLVLTITTLIVKRFEKEAKPYTAMEISSEYKIPIRLTKRILYHLVELEIIHEIKNEDDYPYYQPAIDINKITLEYLFTKIDRHGSENFKVDNKHVFHPEWEAILQTRKDMFLQNKDLLIKNLI
ncbi:MAG: YihY/virulence factor BrkB family protein [Dysgonamonadaceae bacterium]|jgi:membrane protein|nr:YihY/virulence factor BrkB family protein [Dysgonamonadaceae bacterium]